MYHHVIIDMFTVIVGFESLRKQATITHERSEMRKTTNASEASANTYYLIYTFSTKLSHVITRT